MSEPNNYNRADWAGHAMREFAKQVNMDLNTERAECVGDLLANLRHYCDRHGLEFDELNNTGKMHYDAEIAEEKEL